MNVRVVGQDRRDGGRGGQTRPSPGSGSTAAAGTRRNGRRARCPTSKASRRTRRSTRCRRTIPCCSCTRAATPRSPTARRWSCPASGGRPRARPAARSCATRTATRPGLLRERAQRLIKRGAGEPTPTPAKSRGARAQGARARVAGSAVEGHHDLRGRRLAARDHRPHEEDGRRGQDGRPPVGDGAPGQRGDRAEARAVQDDRLRQRPPDRPRDQEGDRRRARARAARGCSRPTPTSPSRPASRPTKVADIDETARLAMQNGFQLCVHAIGDRANRETLDIFERAFKANPAKKDLRWRVEHAQHISAQDIPRFGKMGVIAVDAGHPLHVRRPLRARAPRRSARRGRGLRLAEADEDRRDHRQRHRRARSRTSIRSRATTRASAAS